MSEHGKAGTYVRGCRCEPCTEANTERTLSRRMERYAERELVDGRPIALGAREHGVRTTYNNWGCRCLPCTEVNACASQARRDAARADSGAAS